MKLDSLNKLDYFTILSKISEEASTELAKIEISKIRPLKSETKINKNLNFIDECTYIIEHYENFKINNYKSIQELISFAKKGGVLDNKSLLDISSHLALIISLINYFKELNTETRFPLLNLIIKEFRYNKELYFLITKTIKDESTIFDNATEELFSIRKSLDRKNTDIKNILNGFFTGNKKDMLQDTIITLRDGRYVIPVKSENKHNIKGIVHDTSQSGLTVYIEPASVIEINNEIKILEDEERREINRILNLLTENVVNFSFELINNEKNLIKLDVLFAQASFFKNNDCTRPEFSSDNEIALYNARHLLIDKDKAISSDIILNKEFRQLIITGPNTGGKTVCLKTVGLIALMSKSGFYIPAEKGSRLPLFSMVYVDIGDEQSIDQNLSTFSSHLSNIVYFINHANENDLILIDEIGSGTDPTEGSALGIAILKNIKDNIKCISFVTTHYNELKQYGLAESDVQNASVEFDVNTLQPTYRLLIGIPGSSNAFYIAAQLGLPQNIIEKAKTHLDISDIKFEELINSLNEQILSAKKLNKEAMDNKEQYEFLLNDIETKYKSIDKEKESVLNKAYEEAIVILNKAKTKADDIIKISKENDIKEIIRKRSEINAVYNDTLKELGTNTVNEADFSDILAKKDDHITFKIGDNIYIKKYNINGVIISINNNIATVQIGNIKTNLPLEDLSRQNDINETKFAYKGMASKTFKPTLDIRGLTANEVELEIDKFIDEAVLSSINILTILHGKGNGVLRQKVRDVLATNTFIKDFRPGHLSEGGDGVTIVYL